MPDGAVTKDRLYRTLDRLLQAKEAIEDDLKAQLGTLFRLDYDLLLYDLTSTCFEGLTESNDLAALWAAIAERDAAVLDGLRRQGGPEKAPPEEFFVLVRCADEKEQVALLARFRQDGLSCEAKLS